MTKRTGVVEPPFTDRALDAIGDIFFVFTAEGELLQWNRRVNEVTGYSDEEIAEMHPVEFVPAEEADFVKRHIAKVLEEGHTRLEAHYRTKDGHEIPYEFIGSLLDHNGVPLICGTGRDISERVQAHRALETSRAALRESERRYRRLFEEAQEGIGISTPDGQIIDVNPAVQEILGYSREELLGMNAAELYVDPAERQEAAEMMAEEGAVRDFEAHLRRKDGTEIICQLSSTAHRGPDGEIEAFQTFFRDVTEKRHAEEALRRSERRYRRLFEESQEGITISTPDGTIIDANPAVCQINGYTRTELIGMDAATFYVDAEEREALVRTLREKGRARNVEMRFRRKGGEEFIAQVSATVWRDAEGEIEAIQSFTRDVTEQKRAQEALKESEEKFRVLAEKALVGIALLRGEAFEYVNPAFARIVNRTPEEIIGKPPEMIFHPADRPAVRERIKRRIEGEMQDAHYEARVRTKDGQTRRVEVFGSRITYRGEPAIIGTVQDITERRRLQREVLRVQEEERRRLGQDLHDGVASQLTGIGIMLGTLAKRSAAEESDFADDLREAQELVQESCQDVRRLSRGLAPAGLSGKELPAALERLAENTDRGRFKSDSDLPALEGDTAAHLYWIAQEAVANARKYAEADEIVICLTHENGDLILEVADDGEGFDPAVVEPESLGLRTMRYRTDLLGATLTIDSGPGEGTCVTCHLPVESSGF